MPLPTTTANHQPPAAEGRPLGSYSAAVRKSAPHGDGACFWAGKSGRLYRFTVHSLIECPAPGRGTYILATRGPAGVKAKYIGAAASRVGTVNLARVRHRGAVLGAAEVHFLPVTGTTSDLRRIVRDLRAAVSR